MKRESLRSGFIGTLNSCIIGGTVLRKRCRSLLPCTRWWGWEAPAPRTKVLGYFRSSLTGLFLWVDRTQDLCPGLFSAVPAGLVADPSAAVGNLKHTIPTCSSGEFRTLTANLLPGLKVLGYFRLFSAVPPGLGVQTRKKPAGFPLAGFLVNAGNHLRSHTLTRAVPSAQRGLTSVFGMGTGVTLAVYSPANLGVLQGFVTPCVCSNNLNQSCKNTPLSFWGAWWSLPHSRGKFRWFDLRSRAASWRHAT
jgi:hypothetical protein